eukprot:5636733-Pyramimonas_sp.AAC.1
MNAAAACHNSSKEWEHLRRHLRLGGRAPRKFKGGRLLPMQHDMNGHAITSDRRQADDAFAYFAQVEDADELVRAACCHHYNATAHVDAKQVQ